MYLHQSNNLGNGINLSSTLNSLNNSLNMSDLHNDAFHHLNNQNRGVAHSDLRLQNEENYLAEHDFNTLQQFASSNGAAGSMVGGKLIAHHDEDQFDFANRTTTKNEKLNSLSCSPCSLSISISSANTTLNNITNFISVNSNLNKQLNQLVEQHQSNLQSNGDCDDDRFDFQSSTQNDFTGMDPLTRFLSLHPKYLELFDKFYNFLFNGDGSLQYTVRHYIAIMAAARHHCKYLVNDQQEQFKKVGGDPNWLKGIEYAPKKIQNLNEINKILAHQPWLLTKEHIERFTKGEDNWSLSELVQAIVIMTQFHSLASFVFGCGFNDADLEWSTKTAASLAPGNSYNSNNISDLLLFTTHISSAPPSPPSPNSLVSNLNGILNESSNEPSITDTSLVDSMYSTTMAISPTNLVESNFSDPQANGQLLTDPKVITNPISESQQSTTPPSQPANTLDILMRKMQNISEQKQQFELDNQEELVKNQSLEIHLTPTQTLNNEFSFNISPNGANQSAAGQQPLSPNSQANASPSQLTSKFLGNDEQFETSKFVLDSKFCYADFARQRARTDVTTFKVQDYSWSDHAYSLMNRLYSDVGSMLDEKFVTTYNLTYYTMGRKTNVDTRLFRRAIWNYIQCMYGIRHDDYDYHEINELLERPLKTYIKTVCCFLHQTRKKDCDTVMREFRRSEKIHVNIMIAEARLQAELLYALRTISRYMT